MLHKSSTFGCGKGILTNYHVVANAKDLRVILPDRREFEGRVLGADPETDLAVVKIDARNLPFIPLADSSRARPGDLAFALGNPFGDDETVNMGVVSSMAKGGAGIEGLEDFIQTDAAVNAGNSGGGLVNAHGELIGINTAILFRDASIDRGVCFAVPSNMARGVMDRIIENGRVVRGWLGITSQPLTLELARSFGLSTSRGALISGVAPGGPAAKGGLRAGDIMTSFDGVPVTGGRELSLRVDATPPGSQVRLRFYRNGQAQEARVTLGELGAGDQQNRPVQARLSSAPDLGLKVEPLQPEDKVDLDLAPTTEGIVVGDVAQGSPAALAGVEPGDVIQEVNGKAVVEVSAFRSALHSSQGKLVRLLIDRAGSHFFVALEEY